MQHHRRIVWLPDLRAWLVLDEVPGVGVFTAHFPSAPGLTLRALGGGAEWTGQDGPLGTLRVLDRDADVLTLDSWYSPVYGRKLPVPAVSVRARHGLLACVLHAGGVNSMQVDGSRVEGELRLRLRRRHGGKRRLRHASPLPR